MRIIKFILGLLIAGSAGNEYVKANHELESFHPEIIFVIIIILFFTSWLIGSGTSKGKFKFKSITFLKSIIFSLIAFLFVAFINSATYKTPEQFVNINGYKISLTKCIEGNRRIIPDKHDRKKYCECIAEKFANSIDVKRDFEHELDKGNLVKILKGVTTKDYFSDIGIETCFDLVSLKWTKSIKKTMRNAIKKELINTKFEQTNDLDKYCDCIIKEYQKYSLNRVTKEGFYKSKLGINIKKKCTKESLKQSINADIPQ